MNSTQLRAMSSSSVRRCCSSVKSSSSSSSSSSTCFSSSIVSVLPLTECIALLTDLLCSGGPCSFLSSLSRLGDFFISRVGMTVSLPGAGWVVGWMEEWAAATRGEGWEWFVHAFQLGHDRCQTG